MVTITKKAPASPAEERPAVLRFGVWNPWLTAGFVFCAAEAATSFRHALESGSSTMQETLLRTGFTVGALVCGLLMRRRVRMDEDGIAIGRGFVALPMRRTPWSVMGVARVEKRNRPTFWQRLLHWGQAPLYFLTYAAAAKDAKAGAALVGTRVRLPWAKVAGATAFCDAFEDIVLGEAAGSAEVEA